MLDEIFAESLWEMDPDLEPVALLSQNSGQQGTFTSWSLPYARRRKLNKTEQMIHAALLGEQTIVWEVWQNSLDAGTATGQAGSAPNPKMRDRISAANDNTTWIIVKGGVTQDFNGTLWVIVCQLATGPTP